MHPYVVLVLIFYIAVAISRTFFLFRHKKKTFLYNLSFAITALATSAVPVILLIHNTVSVEFAISFIIYLVLTVVKNISHDTLRTLCNLALHATVLTMYTFSEQKETVGIRACVSCSVVHHMFYELATSMPAGNRAL